MPEHHALFGHLPIMQKRMKSFPKKCIASVSLSDIAKDFPNGVFYLDFAPFDKPTVIVTSANTASQVQKLTQLSKTDLVVTVMNRMCGGTNLFTMSGHVGKLWRNTFSKGFSVAYVQTLAPVIAREVQVFATIIGREAKRGEPVRLVEPVTRLTVDIIASIGM
jgi:sterigmatocystin biosynthesis cytochrome P450 monooxygenase